MDKQTNLVSASRQWENRPDDQRFWTLADLKAACDRAKRQAQEVTRKLAGLTFEATEDGGIIVQSETGGRANVSNLAFSQLASRLDYPVSGIVGKLSADLACKVLEYRKQQIVQANPDEECQILLDCGEDVTIRAVTSDKYARFHDADVIPYAEKLQQFGWKVPPARPNSTYKGQTRVATPEDCLTFEGQGMGGAMVRPGDIIAPAGLYRGDRDMFIFMVDDHNLVDDGGGNPLMQGVFIRNSEVGVSNFSVTKFICQGVCGNHIVWGAEQIENVRYRHIGQAVGRIQESMRKFLLETKPRDWSKELHVIEWMRTNVLGVDRDEVIDKVYGFRENALTKSVIEAALENAEKWRNIDGDPYTWYGFANALTRYSQQSVTADRRFAIDTAAASLFERAAKLAG